MHHEECLHWVWWVLRFGREIICEPRPDWWGGSQMRGTVHITFGHWDPSIGSRPAVTEWEPEWAGQLSGVEGWLHFPWCLWIPWGAYKADSEAVGLGEACQSACPTSTQVMLTWPMDQISNRKVPEQRYSALATHDSHPKSFDHIYRIPS